MNSKANEVLEMQRIRVYLYLVNYSELFSLQPDGGG
jgi:hypothetical protein